MQLSNKYITPCISNSVSVFKLLSKNKHSEGSQGMTELSQHNSPSPLSLAAAVYFYLLVKHRTMYHHRGCRYRLHQHLLSSDASQSLQTYFQTQGVLLGQPVSGESFGPTSISLMGNKCANWTLTQTFVELNSSNSCCCELGTTSNLGGMCIFPLTLQVDGDDKSRAMPS